MPKGDYLGEFEHLVLLALLQLEDDAYGVSVREEIEERTGRSVGIASVYATLDRMGRKGWVEHEVQAPTPVRGGRAKKVYRLTDGGKDALLRTRRMVQQMASGLDLDAGAESQS